MRLDREVKPPPHGCGNDDFEHCESADGPEEAVPHADAEGNAKNRHKIGAEEQHCPSLPDRSTLHRASIVLTGAASSYLVTKDVTMYETGDEPSSIEKAD